MKFFDNVGSNIGLAQRLERLGDPLADPMFPRYLDEPKDDDQRTRQAERMLRARRAANATCCLLLILLATPAIAGTITNTTTPDGKYRVQVGDFTRLQVFELRARREPDGAWHRIGPAVPVDEDVRNIDILLTNERVAWVQGVLSVNGNRTALRSARVDATGPTTLLSHPNPQNGQGFDIPITKISGDRVRFRSDPFVDETFAWYVTPIGGGAIQQEVFSDGFESGGRTKWN